jgi:predicted nucleic acid-binding protein
MRYGKELPVRTAFFAWDPFPLDRRTFINTRDGQIICGLSWWDSLIVASAYQGLCKRIANEAFVDGQSYFRVKTFNPLN